MQTLLLQLLQLQLIMYFVTVHGSEVQASGLGRRTKLKTRSSRKNAGLPHNCQCATNFQIGNDEAGLVSA